ncbi:MAG: M20/M25/M40 family metallo-hydrolase [Pseudonocardiaceae bacterium]|nr:M20/M25/M40 family metallo-hydrolase [Pseudonocardiaceae bacterium]
MIPNIYYHRRRGDLGVLAEVELSQPRVAETVELLQALIRNRCVNTGERSAGHEVRNADVLAQFLGSTVDTQVYDAAPGRRSLVARIEGSDPAAPSLGLLAHTDVVPADDQDWLRDPFGGELVDGAVWGRGAIDMLNMTACMAAAMRTLGATGFRPRGDIVFVAAADEEARAEFGARYLLERHRDDVLTDYVLTEGGGWPLTAGPRPKLSWATADKGTAWLRLRVRGRAGHAAMPYGADNALVKAAEVVRRLHTHRVSPVISDVWRGWVAGMGFDAEVAAGLLDERSVLSVAREQTGDVAAAAHACTHLTITPTMARGGVAINAIPECVEIDVDARTLPGQTRGEVASEIRNALGELDPEVTIEWLHELSTTQSPLSTPVFDTVKDVTRAIVPGTELVPSLITASTDAEYFRRHGAKAYGFSITTDYVSPTEFAAMFHGPNERIDVRSLALSTTLWERLARSF